MKNIAELTFRSFSEADAPRVEGWLKTPRVKQWIPDAAYGETLREHLTDPRIVQWIVEMRAGPIAYLQDYDIHGFSHHAFAGLPPGARGIDAFMASSAVMGLGLGPRYLTLDAQPLFSAGVPATGIDPEPANTATARAYARVGVHQIAIRDTARGPARPMVLWPGQFSR